MQHVLALMLLQVFFVAAFPTLSWNKLSVHGNSSAPSRHLLGSKANDACEQHPGREACLGLTPTAASKGFGSRDVDALPCTWCGSTKADAGDADGSCMYEPRTCLKAGDVTYAAERAPCNVKTVFSDVQSYFRDNGGFAKEWPKSICNNPGRTCERIYGESIPRLISISSQNLRAKDIDFREDDVTCLRSMIKHHTMAAVAGKHKEDAIASEEHGVLNKMQRILEKCDPAMQVWGRKGQVAQATNILLSHFVFAATSTFGAAGMAVPLALQGADWARFLSSINSMDGVLDANTFSKLPSNKREAALTALNAFLQVADVPGAVDLPDAAEFLKVAVENLKEAYEPGEEAGEEDTPALRPNDDQQATLKGIHQEWVTKDCQKSMDRIADEQKKTLEALQKILEAAKSADSIVGEQELVEPAIDQNKSI